MNSRKAWYVTFADSRMQVPLKRCWRQAEAMAVFGDRIRCWTEKDLDAGFRVRMKRHLVPGSRGFGYWCWKPQIILQVMNAMAEGDVLLYADAGCHLNTKGRKRLGEYFELADQHGVVAFQSRALGEDARKDLSLHFLLERHWTKMDVLRYFGVERNDAVLNSGQIGCGILVLKKCAFARQLVEELKNVFMEHFEFCDDSPSQAQNLPGFRENRHDQSVFSVLCKIRGVYTLSSAEYALIDMYAPEKHDSTLWPSKWADLSERPVLARRDLGKFTRSVECPDWLKPLLGRTGRRIASRFYDGVMRLVCALKVFSSPIVKWRFSP